MTQHELGIILQRDLVWLKSGSHADADCGWLWRNVWFMQRADWLQTCWVWPLGLKSYVSVEPLTQKQQSCFMYKMLLVHVR